MNVPFICSNIPAYGVYNSQTKRYSRPCGSYQDFLDRGLLLTRVPFCQVEVITWKIVRSPPCLGWPLWNICVTNDHGYVPLVINTFRSFPRSRLITGFVTRLIRRMPLVEQELFTLPEHLCSPPVFSGVRVTRSLVLNVCFVYRCLSCCTFSFGHCVVWFSSIYSDFPFGIFKLFLLSISYNSV